MVNMNLKSHFAYWTNNVVTVARIATQMGVRPDLAVAVMLLESQGRADAIGDNGTSFGLFQLHKGGELGQLTPAQAMDPETNTRVALSAFRAVSKRTFNTPGDWAAAAQRPMLRGLYAAAVNALIPLANHLVKVMYHGD